MRGDNSFRKNCRSLAQTTVFGRAWKNSLVGLDLHGLGRQLGVRFCEHFAAHFLQLLGLLTGEGFFAGAGFLVGVSFLTGTGFLLGTGFLTSPGILIGPGFFTGAGFLTDVAGFTLGFFGIALVITTGFLAGAGASVVVFVVFGGALVVNLLTLIVCRSPVGP